MLEHVALGVSTGMVGSMTGLMAAVVIKIHDVAGQAGRAETHGH